jgi:hypothetical protein
MLNGLIVELFGDSLYGPERSNTYFLSWRLGMKILRGSARDYSGLTTLHKDTIPIMEKMIDELHNPV